MKAAAGISALLFLAFSVSAQTITRSFGSVVFPGGTSATTPGITRNFGSVVFPGGSPTTPPVRTGPPPVFIGTPRAGRSIAPIGTQNFHKNPGGNRLPRNNGTVYAYPVFVGNYYDAQAYEPPAPVAQPAPPMMTMYNPETARPVMIQVPPPAPETMSSYQPRTPEPEPAPEPQHYLLAFKDHTVYSAVAYWFDGDTLHYFITGSTHNQASVSLLDRELTLRLNKEMGTDFKIPDGKE